MNSKLSLGLDAEKRRPSVGRFGGVRDPRRTRQETRAEQWETRAERVKRVPNDCGGFLLARSARVCRGFGASIISDNLYPWIVIRRFLGLKGLCRCCFLDFDVH